MFISLAASDANSSFDVLVIRHICRLSLPRPGAPASQRVPKSATMPETSRTYVLRRSIVFIPNSLLCWHVSGLARPGQRGEGPGCVQFATAGAAALGAKGRRTLCIERCNARCQLLHTATTRETRKGLWLRQSPGEDGWPRQLQLTRLRARPCSGLRKGWAFRRWSLQSVG